VYLGLKSDETSLEAQRLRLKQLLRDFEATAPADVEAARSYLEQQPGMTGRSWAIFSNAANGFLRALSFRVEMRSRARLLDRPYVKPLADVYDTYAHIGVALVNQEEARFFRLHLGDLTDLDQVRGQPVKRVKHGGASSFPGRRGGTAGQTQHADENIARNLREIAEAASRIFRASHVRRVLVGGSHDVVVRFLAALPKKWNSLVLGSFAADLKDSREEIRQQALRVAHAAELDREARTVSSVITAAAKGKGGVVRLDPTLTEVHAGHVQTLVVADGYRSPGYRCQGCGYLSGRPLEKCPFCGGAFARIDDAVELAVQRVLQDGGEVHIVHASPELEQAGSIGGLLRF
jgi:rubrerythrin